MADILMKTEGLTKHYPVSSGIWSRSTQKVHALDDVNLTLYRREIVGVVGESGCGKSTLAKVLLRLIEPTDGTIYFDGQNITALDRKQMQGIRRQMQFIFQDPFSSLNPRNKVIDLISEPLDIFKVGTRKEREQRVYELLETVGLSRNHADRYPHQFSGGQRQRIGIARALALNPKLVICDEPVSALDVSVQAQILNLLQDLQEQFGLSYLFIAHGLDAVRHISNRIAVMYLGKLVEMGDSEQLFTRPQHPYTQALISAIPEIGLKQEAKPFKLTGEIPSPINPPAGCRFHTRCPYTVERCKSEVPELTTSENGHAVACHLV
ncbi:dipeptide ABC transporter ATP-binding protein [Paenibacillus sp. LMG 31456]|uniref:Dipeptide ABC transporter ATP-binding protein n=1 Tax=Paenibacillus foliorum TaxID=2654974 RepID=A0A972GWC8_9BACL|nr:dipeptide ABC transporter ATP-binding protein [Paenibacillus foliorum]NOU97842.1 dipeptide ABC transporter ATP-binding protein [Paenibacillus foliorum]